MSREDLLYLYREFCVSNILSVKPEKEEEEILYVTKDDRIIIK